MKYYLTKNFRNFGDLDIWTDGSLNYHQHIKRIWGEVFGWESHLLKRHDFYKVDNCIIAVSDNETDLYETAAIESLSPSPKGIEEGLRYIKENCSSLNRHYGP